MIGNWEEQAAAILVRIFPLALLKTWHLEQDLKEVED